MADTLNVRLVQRNDAAANWTAENPVLRKGEPGVETDTKREKTGDGVTPWNNLHYNDEYCGKTATELSARETPLAGTRTHYKIIE